MAHGSSPAAATALDLALQPGLTVLVGENDSGKSAVVDAIRLCLTSSADFTRITADDLHYGAASRADYLQISCTFEGLENQELGSFGEFLTSLPGEAPRLTVTLRAEPFDPDVPHRMSVRVRAGDTVLDGEARERLRATYLRPLRVGSPVPVDMATYTFWLSHAPLPPASEESLPPMLTATVASAKGETHCATLVLECATKHGRSHDLGSLLPVITGETPVGELNATGRHAAMTTFVAATRAKHLLALAVHESRANPHLEALARDGWSVVSL
ncbi:AAA family ATPase [Kitasatospora sp. NPDC048298]|uniref:AAA family ATPase n=1 Tax=Kitasatospora sp. NPDC048298 TaxID=3364049 RepID=UPI0037171FCA